MMSWAHWTDCAFTSNDRRQCMAVIIREARLEDAAGMANVYVQGWRTTYPGIVPDDYLASMSIAAHMKRWQDIFNSAEGYIFVAEDESGNIAGFIWGSEAHDQSDPVYSGEIHVIYVLRSYQGSDIGRRLVQAFVKKLLEEGIKSMIVWVLADNPSRRFYEKLGAKFIRIAPYQVPGTDIFLDDAGYGWRDIHTILEDHA